VGFRRAHAGLLALMLVAVPLAYAQGVRPAPPPGGPRPPPGGQARRCSLQGAHILDGGTAESAGKVFSGDSQDCSAIYVKNGGYLTLTNPRIATTGTTSSEEGSSFYGLNAAVLATQRSRIAITGGSVSSTGRGANGVFATGVGAEVVLTKVTIEAGGDAAHGVMATAGGALVLRDVAITTHRARAAAIATDRGGGTIRVNGGTMRTAGSGSPGIYSTGSITVADALLDASGAEAVVIEGRNSVALSNCRLSAAQRCGVMVYQSFSGDAEGRHGVFTMEGGSLSAAVGPLFYVTNTRATIAVAGAKLEAASGVLLAAAADRWGRSGSNGGHAEFTAGREQLTGDLTCEAGSSISASLQEGTRLTGAIHNAALTLDATSVWHVTADSALTSLADTAGVAGDTVGNIVGHGHTVLYQADLPANRWLNGQTLTLAEGGQLCPAR